MSWCCKDCQRRRVGCHDKCKEYQEQKKVRDDEKKARHDRDESIRGILEWRARQYEKYLRRKRG